MISQADISRIEEATDIVELIGEYVSLKKTGSSFKGCCPFHNEKTPSFSVNPAKQIYKCFGCGKGGDAVSFLMEHDHLSYPDALRKLAKRANIEIEEKERTPEEIAREAKRESMFMLTAQVNAFFVEQIQANELAMDYAVKRWGKNYVDETGIGYAPESKVFLDWVKEQGLNIDLLKELHIIGENDKGGLYAQFRQRVTIPQRSRSNLINGWTCRDISGKEDTPKYLNSSDSDIYQKKDLLFGIDVARHEIRATGKAYVAEGAPDVMRLQIIGVPNAVAPLGTGTMGEDQFKLLSTCYAKTGTRYLCILPDGDIDKENGTNPGRDTAIKIGKAALQLGYAVTIKPIPDTVERKDDKGIQKLVKRLKKEDPDSYFTTIKKFRDTIEEDFILWYANYLFQNNPNTQETNDIVREITSLISMGNDEVRMEGYLKSLKNVYKESSVWNKALKEAKIERQKQEVEKKAFSKDLFKKYGFFEEHGCYYALQGAIQVQWSNFTMEPLFHIKDAFAPKRLYALRGEHGGKEIIELKQEDLVSLTKFRQRIEGLGNYIFEAGEPQLIKLKRYLYEQTETATEIVQLGWQRQGFYAFGNGVFYQGHFIKAGSYCNHIIANREDNRVGCIGTLIQLDDYPRQVKDDHNMIHLRVYADGADEKNSEFEEALEGNFKLIKERVLNPANEKFKADIRKNRPAATEDQLKGRTYFAKEVVGTLIDAIGDFDSAVAKVIELSNTNIKQMELKNLQKITSCKDLVVVDGNATLTEEQLGDIDQALDNGTELESVKTQLTEANNTIKTLNAEKANLQKTNSEQSTTIASLQATIAKMNGTPTPPAQSMHNGDPITEQGDNDNPEQYCEQLKKEIYG